MTPRTPFFYLLGYGDLFISEGSLIRVVKVEILEESRAGAITPTPHQKVNEDCIVNRYINTRSKK